MRIYIIFFLLLFCNISFALTVEEAVEKTLKNFPDIAIASRDIDLQQKDVDIAKGDFLPKLVLSSSYSYINPDDSPHSSSFYNELRLSYNLFSGFYNSNKLDIAKYNLKTKELSLNATTNLIVKNVKSAYFDALLYSRIYKFYNELYENSVKSYEFTKSKFDAGRALSIDVLKSLTEVKKYEAKKIEQKNNLINSLAILGYYTEEKYDINTELSSDFESIEFKSYEEYVAKFEENNPDVKIYDIKVYTANKQISQSRSAFMPILDLYGAISRNEKKSGKIETDTNSSSAGISLSWNLFNGFKDKNDYEKQKINYYNILDQKRKYIKDVKKEILVIYNRLKSAEESLRYQKDLVKVAEENFRLTSEAYELGRATLMELIKAKDELTSAKIDLMNLLNTIMQNYLSLEYYIGGKL